MSGNEHVPHVQRGVEIGTAAHELGPELQILDTRLSQFHPHDARDRTTNDTRDDREDQVERTDVLVVGGHEPAREETGLVVRIVMRVIFVVGLEVVGGSSHRAILSS